MPKTQTKSKSEKPKKPKKPKKPPPKSRRRIRAGWSIPGAAEELGVPTRRMREAIEREQVKVIPSAGSSGCRIARSKD